MYLERLRPKSVSLHVVKNEQTTGELGNPYSMSSVSLQGDYQTKDDNFRGKYSVDVSQRFSDIIWVSIAPSPTPSPEKFGSQPWASCSNFQKSSQDWANHEPGVLPLTNLALSKRHSDIAEAHMSHLGPAPRSTDRIFDGISYLEFSHRILSSTGCFQK